MAADMDGTSIKHDARAWLTNMNQPDAHHEDLLVRLNSIAGNVEGRHSIETELLTQSVDLHVLSKFYDSLENLTQQSQKSTNPMPRQVRLKINRSFNADALFRSEE